MAGSDLRAAQAVLYLDRLCQATAVESAHHNQRFDSLAALHVVWGDGVDDAYVEEGIRLISGAEALVGPAMARLEQRARQVARDQRVRLRQ